VENPVGDRPTRSQVLGPVAIETAKEVTSLLKLSVKRVV